MLQYLGVVFLNLGLEHIGTLFVSFRVDYGERDVALPELEKEVHVDLANVVTGVDEHEKHHKVRGQIDVVAYDLLKLLASVAGHLGVSVARKVHKVPALVDEEVVHKAGLTRRGRGHSQFLA